MAVIVMMMLLVALRYFALRDSRRMMRGDEEQYEALWREEVQKDELAGCIPHLEKGACALACVHVHREIVFTRDPFA